MGVMWSRSSGRDPLSLERVDRLGEQLERLPQGVVAPVPEEPACALLERLDGSTA
jgi:hypothetical protein